MGFFVRALSVLNGAREWVSFANEVFSWSGLAKRTAAVAAGVAAIAAPVVVMSKPSAPTATAVAQTPGQAQSASEVDDEIEKIDSDNIYSQAYLFQPEHRGLLDAIIAKCKATKELPPAQCDIALRTKHGIFVTEQAKKVDERDRRFRESLNSPSKDGSGPSPTQIRMFKE